MRVAVQRCARLPRFVTWEIPDVGGLFADDRRLIDAFAARGVTAEPVVWSDAAVEWDRYDAAMIRSTWDYVDQLEHFLGVMADISASGCMLLNQEPAVRWNADKAYLDDLDRWGVGVVPIVRAMPGDRDRIDRAVSGRDWRELVVKPTVGVGGSGVTRTDADGLSRVLDGFDPHMEVMIQPFADAVLAEGEFSFVFIDGELSHALHKLPAERDFRAHGIYGGTVAPIEPDPSDAREVAAMHAALPFDLLSARIDVVRWEGRLCVLELELIEPMLYLELAPGSAGRLADATIARVVRRS